MKISIIIPTLNEETYLKETLAFLRDSAGPDSVEIIVVDAGSHDATVSIAKRMADQVLSTQHSGRGTQMHEGALVATGELLLFLHADTRLPENWPAVLQAAWQSENPPVGTAFRLKFNRESFVYRLIAWGARMRSEITKIPHGDQGIAVSKEIYFRLGGFPPVPLMEEYYLGRKLLQAGEIRILPEVIVTSVRRYERNGPLLNAIRNTVLIIFHYLGASPATLARFYNAVPSQTSIKLRSVKVMKRIFSAVALLGVASTLHAFDASHALWSQALRKYNHQGLVDYEALKNHPEDLTNYLQTVADVSNKEYGSWKDDEKVAFWINAYNALTWEAIIDHYPIQSSFLKSFRYPKNSIRQIDGVWDKLTFTVMGQKLTLEHIEHEILRKDFNEPRIHMALLCAALGCPPLREDAFIGDNRDRQLDDQSRRFLSNPEQFRMDKKFNVVHLSSIFDWFGDDFIKKYSPSSGFDGKSPKEKAVLNFIRGYGTSDEQVYLKSGAYDVKYLKYDWTLNEGAGR